MSDDKFPIIEEDEDGYGGYRKVPKERLDSLNKAIQDLVPYLKAVEDAQEIDPELKSSVIDLIDGCGWESSSLYC